MRSPAIEVVRAVLLGLLPLALAAGLWQVERDRPLWLTPGASPVPRAATGLPPTLPRLVLAVHYPWYGTPGGPTGRWRHWNHARLEMPQARIRRLPRSPSRDRTRATRHRRDPLSRRAGPTTAETPPGSGSSSALAREAGLDGFLVSWWGRESEDALGLAALFRDAGEAGLVLAPYYETGRALAAGRRGRGGGPGEPPGPPRARARVAPRRRHPRGVPLRVAPAAAAGVGRGARPARGGGPAALPGRRRAESRVAGRAADWLQRFDALHVYTPVMLLARAAGTWAQRTGLSAASRARPGGRSSPPSRPGSTTAWSECPAPSWIAPMARPTNESWKAALAVDPPWILVSSWNEWHEGSEIEPSLEHGRRYIDVTRAWADRFRQRGP